MHVVSLGWNVSDLETEVLLLLFLELISGRHWGKTESAETGPLHPFMYFDVIDHFYPPISARLVSWYPSDWDVSFLIVQLQNHLLLRFIKCLPVVRVTFFSISQHHCRILETTMENVDNPLSMPCVWSNSYFGARKNKVFVSEGCQGEVAGVRPEQSYCGKVVPLCRSGPLRFCTLAH